MVYEHECKCTGTHNDTNEYLVMTFEIKIVTSLLVSVSLFLSCIIIYAGVLKKFIFLSLETLPV